MPRMKHNMVTIQLVKFCPACSRKYTWKSRGYKNSDKCICGSKLGVRPIEVGDNHYARYIAK